MSLIIQKWFDEDFSAPAAGGHTVAVGQVSETDLAQPIAWAPKKRLLGQPAETDLAQPIAHTKLKALGQPSETDLAQPITRVKRRTLGQPSETDLAQPIAHAKLKVLGQPAETDLAQPIARSGSLSATVNQAAETDSAGLVTVILAGLAPGGIDGSGIRFVRHFDSHHENQSKLYNDYLDRLEAERRGRAHAPTAQTARPAAAPPGGQRQSQPAVSARARAAVDSVLAQGLRAALSRPAGEPAGAVTLAQILAEDDEILLMID